MKGYNNSGYIIRISENALIQMVFSGLEAYSIFHRGTKGPRVGLETLGWLWGYEVELANKQSLYSIEFMSIDTSAVREHDYCAQNDRALELKRDLMTSFWPHLDFLGDFHTHPFTHYNEVIRGKDYQFSETDYESIETKTKFWQKNNYRVGLVLTISYLKKKSSRENTRLGNSTIEFTLGNYRLWLKGYIAYSDSGKVKLSSHDDENVYLECPALMGLYGEFTRFGKVLPKKRGSRHMPGEI